MAVVTTVLRSTFCRCDDNATAVFLQQQHVIHATMFVTVVMLSLQLRSCYNQNGVVLLRPRRRESIEPRSRDPSVASAKGMYCEKQKTIRRLEIKEGRRYWKGKRMAALNNWLDGGRSVRWVL